MWVWAPSGVRRHSRKPHLVHRHVHRTPWVGKIPQQFPGEHQYLHLTIFEPFADPSTDARARSPS